VDVDLEEAWISIEPFLQRQCGLRGRTAAL
jgi:hypothetical protein